MGKTGGNVCASNGMEYPSKDNSTRQLPSEQIRLRLLHRLGIHQKKPPISASSEHRRKHTLHGGNSSHGTSVPSVRKAPGHFCLPLKDESDDDVQPSSSGPMSPLSSSSAASSMSPYTASLNNHERQDCQGVPLETQEASDQESSDHIHDNPTTPQRRRRIQFNANVMVVPIPSRHAYSKRIKQAFWMDGAEIQATAERNRYEFASEGWDYQQVLEDEDMYMDVATGQLVHPCWVEDEEDDEEGDDREASNGQGNHEHTDTVEKLEADEEQYLDVKAPTLKRTTSGVFQIKDVESGNDEATTVGDAAALA